MIKYVFSMVDKVTWKLDAYRLKKRWVTLKSMGMHIGTGVNLPMNTFIDTPHCFLISIGDNCGFGGFCKILAHDAMPNEYIDATRIGKVKIHESCHFGMGTIILPGVEIGPRSIIGAGSVVNSDIPADSVAVGNPAKVLCSMDHYLNKQKEMMKTKPTFEYNLYDYGHLTPERKKEMLEKLEATDGYIVGGYTAMVEEGKCLVRT